MHRETPRLISTMQLNRALVCSGVARFATRMLPTPAPLFTRLAEEADLAQLLGLPAGEWDAALQLLSQQAPQLPGPFGQLLRDYQLQLHEWFLLALCGETEASHLLNLAVAELQAPQPTARASLHLVEQLTAVLFGAALGPLALPNHRLLRAGVLNLHGEGPLPGRQLGMAPELWSLLCGDFQPWPHTRPLQPKLVALPAQLLRQLDLLATQLRQGQVRTIVLRGNEATGRAAAAELAERLGLLAIEVAPGHWSEAPGLAVAAHYGSWLPVLPLALGAGETHAPEREHLRQTPLVLLCGQDGTVLGEAVLELTLPGLTRAERQQAWQAALSPPLPAEVTEQALVDGATIQALAERIHFLSLQQQQPPGPQHLRHARASFGAERLRLLAQPVQRHVEADGLILTDAAQQQFDDLVRRCQRREQLWQGLGASLAEPTPGVRALFVGESGAGKTLAASRLATLLGAPLFRVDLAAVMNKYIGESEKNLGRVLDEAAAIDALLLMDEADALFGRRSDGNKDGGERYANMLTNFLLTRIESHPGIVVLTSNSRNRIDPAFSRRFDAIIEFPLPGVEERLRLWQSHLGRRAPGERICRLLASYCELPGGHIRNVVLNAAASSPQPAAKPIPAGPLLAALRAEYQKLGRTLPAQLEHLTG